MTATTFTPRLHAQLQGPSALGESGVADLTLINDGATRDVYRLTVETEFHQRTAYAQPAIVRLEPGASGQVRVESDRPVLVRVYSEVSGQLAAESYLGR